jgi:hypothetical protein
MALNLFGPPTKDDIKVAYIDPTLGLVEGVSIAEAIINPIHNRQSHQSWLESVLRLNAII